MQKKAGLVGLLLFISSISLGQILTQAIRGIVIDKDSRRPLAGATVSIAEDSVQRSAITSDAGIFVLSNIPVGRRRIQCTYSGYENYITDNIILNSAKELELVIELEQHYQQQSEVIVKAARNPKQPVNKSSVVSTQIIYSRRNPALCCQCKRSESYGHELSRSTANTGFQE